MLRVGVLFQGNVDGVPVRERARPADAAEKNPHLIPALVVQEGVELVHVPKDTIE